MAVAHWLPGGFILEMLALFSLIAQRDLHHHVARVVRGLREGGVEGGRAAVAHIVGRDPQTLDAAGVARAALESLAENFSDGVVAPVFWYVVLGLPGVAAYKAINTLDSMIGHRSEHYRAFGWASARIDDVVNWLPARLSGLLVVAGALLVRGTNPREGLAAMRRDAPRHNSPNAGWPEAALAGALGIALAGPRHYGDHSVDGAWMGRGRAEVTPDDMDAALRVYLWACVATGALAVAICAGA